MADDGHKPDDRVVLAVLIAMTAVTGMVDAVSFLALGRVFTANMTGNIVLLGFASTGLAGVSVARSLAALAAFLAGAIAGGRSVARAAPDAVARIAPRVFAVEAALLAGAAAVAIGFDAASPASAPLYAIIALTGVAMGARTAVIRKLAVPDLTTTVLTLTIAGLAADSTLAGGGNPRWQRRVAAIVAMGAGAALGALIVATSIAAALAACAGASAACTVALFVSRGR